MSEIKRVPEIYPIPSQLPDHEPDLGQGEQEESSEQKDNQAEEQHANSKPAEQDFQASMRRTDLWKKLEDFEKNKKES